MTYGGPQPTHPGVTWEMHTFGANIFLHKVNGKVRKPAQTMTFSAYMVGLITISMLKHIKCFHKLCAQNTQMLRFGQLCCVFGDHDTEGCNAIMVKAFSPRGVLLLVQLTTS